MKYSKRSLTEHINTEYRNYAIHALENRGIPNFYDSITPVQRFIIQSAPLSFTKTASVVGDVIKSGYHHGPVSLENAINGITRNFLCSDKILDGDGFFGNTINPDAAASRYTSIKLNPKTKDIVNKYSKLNSKSENDPDSWNPLKVEIPFGLCVQTNGVGVGYACFILPRKIEHILEFFEGKRKSLKPFFLNFDGKIIKNKESEKSSWIIEPLIEGDYKTKTIYIKDISPIISYSTYIKKINSIIEKYNCKFENNTREKINIELKFSKDISSEEFSSINEDIKKFSTSTVTENIVIIKDSSVLEYNSIEDYLSDFSRYREFLFLEKVKFDLKELDFELEYFEARKKYLEFMMSKKRNSEEIENFLSQFSKDTYNRLDAIKLRFLNPEFLKKTIEEIEKYKGLIKEKKIEVKEQENVCSKIKEIVLMAKRFAINSQG